MRMLLPAVCAVLFSVVPLSAQQSFDAERRATEAEQKRMQDNAAFKSRVRTDTIVGSTTEDWVVIPAAGSLPGNFGTFYKSDVTIANYRSIPQVVRARWLPIGQTAVSTDDEFITVPANSFVNYNDFVGEVLGKSGLGAIEFVARDEGGSLDLDAQIDVYSRIWTPQPNTTLGTVSQNFDSVGFFHTQGSTPVHAIGLKQNAQFRTNVGIVNLDLFEARTFTVSINGTNGQTQFQITVPSYSMIQQGIPAGDWGSMRITFTPSAATDGRWVAYATSNDNGTGDGWVAVGARVVD